MITVSFEENKEVGSITLKIEGHSRQAEPGKDVICASSSILAYTVAQVAEFMYKQHKLKKKPHVVLDSGNANVTVKPKTDYYAEALHAFLVAEVGYSLLAHNFSDFVQVKAFDTAS